jgi:hypothetical protein
MPELLDGWTRAPAVNGVVLTPPPGVIARIRLHDREPPRPLRALVAALGTNLPAGARFELVDGPRPLVTVEGEHAAFLSGVVRLGEAEVQRTVGVIITDERFAIVDGQVETRAHFDEVRRIVETLTRGYCLGLGAPRWRSTFYTPPPGWQGLPRVRAHLWLAPGYPRPPATIQVFHARPRLYTPAVAQHRLVYEDVGADLARVAAPTPAPPTRSGLNGQTAEFARDSSRVINIAYEDKRYIYLLRLETDAAHRAAHLPIFHAVAQSLAPVPDPASAEPAAIGHWLD